MWTKFKEFIKKNWLALVALITSIFAFIFNRNREQRLGDSEQLCTDVGERITDAKDGLNTATEQLTDSQSQVESISNRVDEISRKAVSAGDIVRKYQSRANESNKTE